SGRRHTSATRDWSSDVCSSDLTVGGGVPAVLLGGRAAGHRAGEAPAGAGIPEAGLAGEGCLTEGGGADGQDRGGAGVGADAGLRSEERGVGQEGGGCGGGGGDR